MFLQHNFTQQLKKLMSSKGITQRHLANAVGISENSLSRYISGDRTPNLDVAIALAECLGVSLDTLLGDNAPKFPAPTETDVLLSCYSKASDNDKLVLWTLLSRYMTPKQKEKINEYIKNNPV